MLAVLGGLGAATAFALATICSARSSRLIGAGPVLAWVMLTGLLAVLPWVAATGLPPALDDGVAGLLTLAGVGNVVGLFLAYSGLRIGRVALVAPVVSTEGAVAALLAALAGEHVSAGVAVVLAVIAVGIVLASVPLGSDHARASPSAGALLAAGAALFFGLSLYATGKAGETLPLVWAIVPVRVAGVVFVALPLALTARLRLTRTALPLVLTAGLAEVVGFASYALGARHGIAVSAVLASQFGALAALAAFVLFRERLGRLALVGVAVIVVGVAALSGLQA